MAVMLLLAWAEEFQQFHFLIAIFKDTVQVAEAVRIMVLHIIAVTAAVLAVRMVLMAATLFRTTCMHGRVVKEVRMAEEKAAMDQVQQQMVRMRPFMAVVAVAQV